MVCNLGNCSLRTQMSQLTYFAYTKQPAAHKNFQSLLTLIRIQAAAKGRKSGDFCFPILYATHSL